MADVGKKDGNVRVADYQTEQFLKRVEPVARQLQQDIPEAKYDRKSIALLLAHVQQFSEDALGKDAPASKPFAKLPARLFRDFSPTGSVYVIAAKCHELLTKRHLEKADWQNPSKHDQNLELLTTLKKELEGEGKLAHPSVYIDSACDNADTLKNIVNQLGGRVATAPDDAGVTHIVYPFGDGGDPDDGKQYIRSLEESNGGAFVHWWYLPESYDEWVPSATAPEGLEPDHDAIGPWKVYVRWLHDSHKYNEWMNPIDYETEEFQDEQERFRKEAEKARCGEGDEMDVDGRTDGEATVAGGNDNDSQGKRKRDDNSPEKTAGEEGMSEEGERESKRSKAEEPAPRPEIDPLAAVKIASNVVKHKVIEPHRSTMEGAGVLEDISQGQQPQPIPGVSLSEQVPKADPPKDVEIPDVIPPAPPKVQKEMYRVPAYGCWFDWNKIDDLERQLVPEFFNGRASSKTPQIYKEYRDFIINKYRENPERVLSFTEVRKQLTGDVIGIYRVFNFLDNWGLINYMAKDRSKDPTTQVEVAPLSGGPISAKLSNQNPAPSTSALFRFGQTTAQEGAEAATKGAQGGFNLITRKNHYGTTANDKSVNPPQFRCNAMPWVDCTAVRYHCVTIPDVDLCPQAYAEGRFPPGTSAKDFIRLDQSTGEPNADGWSQQETLLLLEALELYNDNWMEVAEHVGTKSQLQCIMHFLQLPIEDQFVEQMASASQPPTIPPENGGSREELEEEVIPFADASNPVMAQVAFLAAMVGPKVAAAAAQRALEVLSEEDPAAAQEHAANQSNGNVGGDPLPAQNGNPTIDARAASSNGVSSSKMRVAAATALSAAAVKAKLMAEQEEREIQRLVVTVIDSQLKKMDAKLKYCEELDKALDQERLSLKAARQRVDSERQQLRQLINKAAAAQQQSQRAQHQIQSQIQAQIPPVASQPGSAPVLMTSAQPMEFGGIGMVTPTPMPTSTGLINIVPSTVPTQASIPVTAAVPTSIGKIAGDRPGGVPPVFQAEEESLFQAQIMPTQPGPDGPPASRV
ncbi:hypothetical protein BSKO_06807 [Bryopsis sp. KO-2023]|nr:hypothetical protein BSKO_06807 [Bryopsis sp. KO-2023]